MRILEVISSLDPHAGGPVEGLLQQARQRERDGLAVTHVVSLDEPGVPWVLDCPLTVFPLGLTASEKNWFARLPPLCHYRYTPKLVPWLRANASAYDAIIINGLWNYTALGARRALRSIDRPYVVFVHGMLDPWFRRTYPVKHIMKQIFWLFSEGPLLAHARAAFFTTEDERKQARGGFWPYRVKERVVAFGTSDQEGDAEAQIRAFRTHMGQLGERRFFLFLSRIHPKKGCDLLIRAFAAIAGSHPDLDLVIAGPDQVGWRKELEALAENLEAAGRIHWPGMLSGDLKWGAFRACEAFVLPSHQENFGVVVAEAMAAEKPVLISDKVNIWREVVGAEAGLVGSDDLQGTTNSLCDFLQLTPGEKAAMGQAARRVFIERFEMRRVARVVVDALKEVAV
jgi:glycosyltransferase involved in cell wall biosynthesis